MKTPRKIRLFICIIWVLVGIALVFCVQFNKHNLKVQPVISKIVLGYVITSMILAGFCIILGKNKEEYKYLYSTVSSRIIANRIAWL